MTKQKPPSFKTGAQIELAHTFGAHGTSIHASLYGPQWEEHPFEWSFAHLKNQGDEMKRPTHTHALWSVANRHHVQRIWAPRPTQLNGLVTHPENLKVRVLLSTLVSLHRGVDADGVSNVRHYEAFAMSAGGCPVLIASSKNWVMVGHAGLESLFNFEDPERLGIAANMVAAFGDHGKRHGIEFLVAFAIPPKVYLHPINDSTFGEQNRARAEAIRRYWGDIFAPGIPKEQGAISIPSLVELQLKKYEHVNFVRHDKEFLPDKPGHMIAHTRNSGSTKIGNKEVPNRDLRNLIFVTRVT